MSVSGARQPSYLTDSSPTRHPGPVGLVRDLVHEFRHDEMGGAAAELAFRFALAVFPFLLLTFTIGAFFAHVNGGEDPSQQVVDLFSESLPGDAASVIRNQTEQVIESDSLRLLAIGLAGTLWTATTGTLAIMRATNRVYDVKETRSLIRRIGLALLISAVAGGAVVVALVATLASEVFADDIVGAVGLDADASWLVSVARVPMNLVIIVAAASLVFWLAPNRDRPFRLVTPGAIVFAIGWVAATYLFALYVANVANYSALYGTLGAALVFLIWLQITTTLLLLGAELNTIVDPDVDTGSDAP